jgi:hypothetical protein
VTATAKERRIVQTLFNSSIFILKLNITLYLEIIKKGAFAPFYVAVITYKTYFFKFCNWAKIRSRFATNK